MHPYSIHLTPRNAINSSFDIHIENSKRYQEKKKTRNNAVLAMFKGIVIGIQFGSIRSDQIRSIALHHASRITHLAIQATQVHFHNKVQIDSNFVPC